MVHQEMLNAFVARDYVAASRLAHHLGSAAFDGYPYQPRAQELERQLADRQDDFKALRLPTEHEWALLKKSLSRPQQVQYLVARLRLLSAMQMGQPGGISFGDEQYATLERKVLVVNPATTLLDMHLTSGELAGLVPHLGDEDFVLAFSFFRDFMPERNLYRVNEVVANVINWRVGHTVIDMSDYYSRDPAQRPAWLAQKALALSHVRIR
jgi:hypothetical protein